MPLTVHITQSRKALLVPLVIYGSLFAASGVVEYDARDVGRLWIRLVDHLDLIFIGLNEQVFIIVTLEAIYLHLQNESQMKLARSLKTYVMTCLLTFA